MTAPFENIVQHLFHQPSLQSVTVEELQRVANENPSFAAAQFLLLKKLQETAHPGFKDQLQKTTLYFNNPLWLEFLLQPKKNTTAPATVIQEKKDEVIQEEETTTPVYQNVVELAEISTTEHTSESTYSSNGNGTVTEEHSTVSYIQQTEEVTPVAADEQPITGDNGVIIENNDATKILPAEAEPVVTAEINTSEETPVVHEAAAETFTQPEETTPHIEESEAREHSFAENTMASANVIIETTDSAKQDLLFEPFHTVDYFASQGIKLDRMESIPQDRLGTQLKSFTEWLKSMKKLPQVKVDQLLAENDESKVVAAANSSVEDKEVITETMAEVFEKQGLHDRAIGVYRKLSLLNPAKSAYFAAKIEDLKK